jgi:MFS family permease
MLSQTYKKYLYFEEKVLILRRVGIRERERTCSLVMKCFCAKPRIYLCLLMCTLNFLTLFDKGLFRGTIEFVTEEFGLSEEQAGFLSTTYTIGHIFSTIFFGWLYGRTNPLRIVGFGTLAWAGCAFAYGISPWFWFSLIARGATGFAEGAVIVVCPAFISLVAPLPLQARWLGFLFISSTAGSSVGVFLCGLLLDSVNWRHLFVGLCFTMSLFSIICLYMPMRPSVKEFLGTIDIQSPRGHPGRKPVRSDDVPLTKLDSPSNGAGQRKNSAEEEGNEDENLRETQVLPGYLVSLRILATDRLFIYLLLGSTAGVIVLGGISLYVLQYVALSFNEPLELVDLSLSALTLSTGIAGPMFGGFITDLAKRKHRAKTRGKEDLDTFDPVRTPASIFEPTRLNMALCVMSAMTMVVTFLLPSSWSFYTFWYR